MTGRNKNMKKIICSVFSFFVAVILAAQSPVHIELNSVTGVYSKGETVEVYATLTEIYSNNKTKKLWSIKLGDIEGTAIQ